MVLAASTTTWTDKASSSQFSNTASPTTTAPSLLPQLPLSPPPLPTLQLDACVFIAFGVLALITVGVGKKEEDFGVLGMNGISFVHLV
jgi:hypothetical protein